MLSRICRNGFIPSWETVNDKIRLEINTFVNKQWISCVLTPSNFIDSWWNPNWTSFWHKEHKIKISCWKVRCITQRKIIWAGASLGITPSKLWLLSYTAEHRQSLVFPQGLIQVAVNLHVQHPVVLVEVGLSPQWEAHHLPQRGVADTPRPHVWGQIWGKWVLPLTIYGQDALPRQSKGLGGYSGISVGPHLCMGKVSLSNQVFLY